MHNRKTLFPNHGNGHVIMNLSRIIQTHTHTHKRTDMQRNVYAHTHTHTHTQNKLSVLLPTPADYRGAVPGTPSPSAPCMRGLLIPRPSGPLCCCGVADCPASPTHPHPHPSSSILREGNPETTFQAFQTVTLARTSLSQKQKFPG